MKKLETRIFCENVKYLRAVNELSKSEMAQILGISVKSLTSIEEGVVPPRLSCDVVFKIQDRFGIAPTNMFISFADWQGRYIDFCQTKKEA